MTSVVSVPASTRTNTWRKQGVFVSGSGVRSIWLRHDLENFKKRLKALEAKVAAEGLILNDAQIAALEKKQHDDEACGEIETAHLCPVGIPVTWVHRIPFTSATSKGLGGYTNRLTWTPIAKSRTASCIQPKRPLPQRIS